MEGSEGEDDGQGRSATGTAESGDGEPQQDSSSAGQSGSRGPTDEPAENILDPALPPLIQLQSLNTEVAEEAAGTAESQQDERRVSPDSEQIDERQPPSNSPSASSEDVDGISRFPKNLTLGVQSYGSADFHKNHVQDQLKSCCTYSITSEDEVAKWRNEVIKVAEEKNNKSWSLLHLAVGKNGSDDPEFFGLLLATGLDPNIQTKGGFTALHICVAFGRPKCLQLLLECRANFRQWTRTGDSPQSIVKEWQDKASSGNVPPGDASSTLSDEQKIINFQIALGGVSEILGTASKEGAKQESLASLAKRGRFFSVQNLMRRGLSAVLVGEFEDRVDGNCAEEWARRAGRLDVARELGFWAKRAKDIDAVIPVKSILQDTKFDDPPHPFRRPMEIPLCMTSAWMHQGVMKKALQPYLTCPLRNKEMFEQHCREIVEPYHTEVDQSDGWDATHNAVGNEGSNDEEALGTLLAMGINPDRPHRSWFRSSHHCAVNARPTCLEVLLQCRVDLNAGVGNGNTPLDLALIWQKKADEKEFPWTDEGNKGFGGWSSSDKTVYPKRLAYVIELLVKRSSRSGPETLPELACNGRFLPIQNLMRRVPQGAVKYEEFVERHNGLTAQQWAIELGRPDIAAEMEFWKNSSTSTSGSSWPLMAMAFPRFDRPKHNDIHTLGDRRRWSELRAIIEPFVQRPVCSDEEDQELKKLQRMFETEKFENGWTIVHDMVGNDGGDDPEIFGLLAATGSDLDLTDGKKQWRPVHLSALNARAEVMKILVDCRVDLAAEQNGHLTALALAEIWNNKAARQEFPWTDEPDRAFCNLTDDDRRAYASKIMSVVETLELAMRKDKPDNIALLAKRKSFAALQHVLRRRTLVMSDEFRIACDGKTAKEWAAHHGRLDIAKEIDYRRAMADKIRVSSSGRNEPRGAERDTRTAGTSSVFLEDYALLEQKGETIVRWGVRPLQHQLESKLMKYARIVVNDPTSKARVRRLAQALEKKDKDGDYLIETFVSNSGSDDVELFSLLLSFGIDPDTVDKKGWRAVHQCATNGRVNCLQQLFRCRADMFTTTSAGMSALGLAQSWLDHVKQGRFPWSGESNGFETWKEDDRRNYGNNVKEVCTHLKNWKAQKPPSLVKLARNKDFLAIRHILRRRNFEVPKDEFHEIEEGRNAVDWARAHERDDIAVELLYYMKKWDSSKWTDDLMMSYEEAAVKEFPLTPAMEQKASATLGQKGKWPILREICRPFSNFAIINAKDDTSLQRFAEKMDKLKQANGWSNVHDIVGNLGSDNKEVLGLYLSLGTDPDVPLPRNGARPLHLCVQNSRIECLKSLISCRADVHAQDSDGDTAKKCGELKLDKKDNKKLAKNSPIAKLVAQILLEKDGSKTKELKEILEILEAAENGDYPSLAELAKRQEMTALQHLIRRPNAKIPLWEYFETPAGADGRDELIAWAWESGRSDIAQEIRYRRYKALAVHMDSSTKLDSTSGNFQEATRLIWTGKNAKRSWDMLMDYCAWLVTENPIFLTCNVKHYIEMCLESWLKSSGKSGTRWLYEWFDHIACLTSPTADSQAPHDHGPLAKFITIAKDILQVELKSAEDACSKDEPHQAAWFVLILLTQLMKTPAPCRQGEPQGKLWTWLRRSPSKRTTDQLCLYAELVDACWAHLSVKDWQAMDDFLNTAGRELTADGVAGSGTELRTMLHECPNDYISKLRSKLCRIGIPLAFIPAATDDADDKSLSPAGLFWKRIERKDDATALGILRTNPFSFPGNPHHLQRAIPEDLKQVGWRQGSIGLAMNLGMKSIAIQLKRLCGGSSIVEMARDKRLGELSDLLKAERISPDDVAEELDGRNAAEWCEMEETTDLRISAGLNRVLGLQEFQGKTLAEHAKDKKWQTLTQILDDPRTRLKPSHILHLVDGKHVIGWCTIRGETALAGRFRQLLLAQQGLGAAASAAGQEDTLRDLGEFISSRGKRAFLELNQQGENLIQQVMDKTYRFQIVRKFVLEEFRTRDQDRFEAFMAVLTIDDALNLKDAYLKSLVLERSATVSSTGSIKVKIPLRSRFDCDQLGVRENYFTQKYLKGDEEEYAGLTTSGEHADHIVHFLDKVIGSKFARKSIIPNPVIGAWVAGWWHARAKGKYRVAFVLHILCIMLATFSQFSIGYHTVHGLGPTRRDCSPLPVEKHWHHQQGEQLGSGIMTEALTMKADQRASEGSHINKLPQEEGTQQPSKDGSSADGPSTDHSRLLKDQQHGDGSCSAEDLRGESTASGWLWFAWMCHLGFFFVVLQWDVMQWIPSPWICPAWSLRWFAWMTIHTTAFFCMPTFHNPPTWVGSGQWYMGAFALVTCLPLASLLIAEAMLPTGWGRRLMVFVEEFQDFKKLAVQGLILPAYLFYILSTALANLSLPSAIKLIGNLNSLLKPWIQVQEGRSLSPEKMPDFMEKVEDSLHKGELDWWQTVLLAEASLIFVLIVQRLSPGSKADIQALQTERKIVFAHEFLRRSRREGTPGRLKRLADTCWKPFKKILQLLNSFAALQRLILHITSRFTSSRVHALWDKSGPGDFFSERFQLKSSDDEDSTQEACKTEAEAEGDWQNVVLLLEDGDFQDFADAYFQQEGDMLHTKITRNVKSLLQQMSEEILAKGQTTFDKVTQLEEHCRLYGAKTEQLVNGAQSISREQDKVRGLVEKMIVSHMKGSKAQLGLGDDKEGDHAAALSKFLEAALEGDKDANKSDASSKKEELLRKKLKEFFDGNQEKTKKHRASPAAPSVHEEGRREFFEEDDMLTSC